MNGVPLLPIAADHVSSQLDANGHSTSISPPRNCMLLQTFGSINWKQYGYKMIIIEETEIPMVTTIQRNSRETDYHHHHNHLKATKRSTKKRNFSEVSKQTGNLGNRTVESVRLKLELQRQCSTTHDSMGQHTDPDMHFELIVVIDLVDWPGKNIKQTNKQMYD